MTFARGLIYNQGGGSGPYVDAPEGVRFASLSSQESDGACTHNEAMFQEVDICEGAQYELRFSYRGISFENGTISVALTNGLVNVALTDDGFPCYTPASGAQIISTTLVNGMIEMWQNATITFTAGNLANNQLVFWVNADDVGFNAALDNISLVCIGSPLVPAISFAGMCPTYRFFGSTNTVAGLGVDSWCWDFGDGTTGTGQVIFHTYTTPGTYDVCLTIADDCSGCAETVCQTVICNPEPPVFTCPCTGPGTLNIDASETNPHYDPVLGGTLYSVLEAAFNYDQDNNGDIELTEHRNCIAVAGKLILDRDVSILNCANIQMQPCSEIVVRGLGVSNPATHATFLNNTIYGCEIMWHSITVEPHGWLTFTNNTISDAEYANMVYPASLISLSVIPTRYDAQNNRFFRNHIGLYVPGSGGFLYGPNLWHAPFTGNEMACAGPGYTLGPLLPACAMVDNYNSVNGYAGVAILAGTFQVGVPGPGSVLNRFSNLRNGIIGEKVQLIVDRAEFNNMIGFYGDAPSFSFSSGVGVAALGGWNTIRDSRFNIAGHGIATSEDLLTVEKNQMTKVRFGLESWRSALFRVAQNKDIQFLNFGMRAHSLMNIPWPNGYVIDDNVFRTQGSQTGHVGNFAIYLSNGSNTTLAANVPHISLNQIFINDFVSGVGINNINSWSISDNPVVYNAPANSSFLTSEGFVLQNSHNNFLYANSVKDNNGPMAAGTIGFNVHTSIRNRFCCNSADGNEIGASFWGNCIDTRFRLNTMDNHQFSLILRGDSLMGYTVISHQPPQVSLPLLTNRNRFEAASGIALNPAPTLIAQQSKFFVTDLTQPNYPPSVATPSALAIDWFDTNRANSYECGDEGCSAPDYTPRLMLEHSESDENIREDELAIADHTYDNIPNSEALRWEGELGLYARLKSIPALLGNYPSIDVFYESIEQGNDVKSFYDAELIAASVYEVPESWALVLENAKASVEEIDQAAKDVLLSLASAETRADSLEIYWQSEEQRSGILPHLALILEKEREIDLLRRTRATEALPIVLALPENDVLQGNRKTSLKVGLELVASGASQLSLEQFIAISAIAHQCPLSGGSAVYTARDLYNRNQQKRFDDDVFCRSVEMRYSTISAPNNNVTISPNPNDGKFQLRLTGITAETNVMVRILDMSGKVLLTHDYITQDGNLVLDASKISSGLYICHVSTTGRMFTPVKFAIAH